MAVYVLSAINRDSIEDLPHSHLSLWQGLRAGNELTSTGNCLLLISHTGTRYTDHGGGTGDNFAGNYHIGDDTSPINIQKLAEATHHGYSGGNGTCTTNDKCTFALGMTTFYARHTSPNVGEELVILAITSLATTRMTTRTMRSTSTIARYHTHCSTCTTLYYSTSNLPMGKHSYTLFCSELQTPHLPSPLDFNFVMHN